MLWSKRLGATMDDRGNGVAVDGSGNIYTIGYFNETVDFGGTSLSVFTIAGFPPASDLYYARYSPSGVNTWAKRIGAHGVEVGTAIKVNSIGNVVITGNIGSNVDFGAGELEGYGGWDFFVGEFDGNDGSYKWVNLLGSDGNEFCSAVALDADDNMFITGTVVNPIDLGGGSLTGNGSQDIYVAKYAADTGAHLWSRRIGGTSTEVSNALATDAAGNVVVVGNFNGTVDFGGGPLTSAGQADIFVVKYEAATGNHLWSKRLGGTSTDRAEAVAIDSNDNVIVSGEFIGSVNFGGSTLNTPNATDDIFLAQYSPAGVHQWSRRIGGTNTDYLGDITLDIDDNVVVTGQFQNTVNFGGGGVASAGAEDIFVARYTPGGVFSSVKRLGGTNYEISQSVAVDSGGDVVITGYFPGTTNLGGDPLTSAGSFDIHLVKITP